MKVERTNGIPICPSCKEPTVRQPKGSSVTLLNYTPIYNEEGINTNPDRNTVTSVYSCIKCAQDFCVKGNEVDGFKYVGV